MAAADRQQGGIAFQCQLILSIGRPPQPPLDKAHANQCVSVDAQKVIRVSLLQFFQGVVAHRLAVAVVQSHVLLVGLTVVQI